MKNISSISSKHEQIFHDLGIEMVGMEKLCPEYWIEITDAFHLMYYKFPILQDSIKSVKIIDKNDLKNTLLDLDIPSKYLFGCVRFPSTQTQNYDIIYNQTIYLGKTF